MHVFLRSGTTDSFGVPAEADEKRQPVGVEMLDAYALERWEARPKPAMV